MTSEFYVIYSISVGWTSLFRCSRVYFWRMWTKIKFILQLLAHTQNITFQWIRALKVHIFPTLLLFLTLMRFLWSVQRTHLYVHVFAHVWPLTAVNQCERMWMHWYSEVILEPHSVLWTAETEQRTSLPSNGAAEIWAAGETDTPAA
jgi:hypothetical protein